MARRIVSTAKPVETQAPLNAETGAPKPPITNPNPAQEPEADKAKSNVVAPEPDDSAARKGGDDKKPEGDKVDPAAREPGTRKTDPAGTPVVTAKPAAAEPVTTTLEALAAVSSLPKGTAAVTPAVDHRVVTPPTDAELGNRRFCATCGANVTGQKFCSVDGTPVEAADAANAVAAKKPDPAPAKAEVVTPAPRVITPPALPAAPVTPVAEWYVRFSKDDVQGPVTEEELAQAIKEGHIVAETQVHHPAIGWKSVAESPFASFLSTPATPAPAPPPPLRPQAPAPPPLPAATPPVAQTPTATATPPAAPAFKPETHCGNPRCGVARFLPTDKRCRTPGCGYVFKVPS